MKTVKSPYLRDLTSPQHAYSYNLSISMKRGAVTQLALQTVQTVKISSFRKSKMADIANGKTNLHEVWLYAMQNLSFNRIGR